MTQASDWYGVLGVSEDAGDAEIRAAYRHLARLHHPDLNPGDKEAGARMATINAAYEALRDEDHRSRYAAGTVAVEEEREEWEEYAPVVCERCGCQDASLRLTLFVRVLSIVVYTRRFGDPEILCRHCRARRALEVNAFNACLGWWSIHGVFFTPVETVRNMLGGRQPDEFNQDMLRLLALQLHAQGAYEGAAQAWNESEALEPMTAEETQRLVVGQGVGARPSSRFGGLGRVGALMAAIPASVVATSLVIVSILAG